MATKSYVPLVEGIGITGQKADAHIVHFLIAQLLPIDGGEVFHVQAEQIEVLRLDILKKVFKQINEKSN